MRHFVFLLLFASLSYAAALPVTATRKAISEVIENALKVSGKSSLKPAARHAAEKALLQAFRQYGDDVFKVVSKGGLEALEQGSKHGKLFWELCSHSPKAVRQLALHADDLLPVARRIGPEFMKLESALPGMGKQAAEIFGDDAIEALVKMPKGDAAKLIRIGSKADSPQTAKALFKHYKTTSGRILRHLDAKKILATGLSASALVTAYKVSDGVEEGIKDVAHHSPETFTQSMTYGIIGLIVLVVLLLGWLLFPARKWLKARLNA